jgi:HAMP domain-containing protein
LPPSAATARRCCTSTSPPRRPRQALAGLEGTGEITGYRGAPTLASWGPLAIAGAKWALIAKIDSAEALAPIHRLERDLAIVGGFALLVVVLTGAWLSHALMRPLRELTAGVKLFAAGDRAAQVQVRTADEIGQLCLAFNGMVARDQHTERADRGQEPRERGAAAQRPAGADRRPSARRRKGHRRRLAEVTVSLPTWSASRRSRRTCRRRMSSPC